MLNVIIIDDEFHALQAIKFAVEWDQLGIDRVFEASNIEQAKEKFRANPIHIMLCDIEMPQGSGLDLLEWVRQKYPDVKCIFLTCHAEFKYAKRAIELGSTEYILKPVPGDRLKDAVLKAIQEIKNLGDLVERGQLWVEHHPLFVEHFWFDVIKGKIAPSAQAFATAAQERGITCPEDTKFIPVLFSLERVEEINNLAEIQRGLKQMISGLIKRGEENVVQLGHELLLALTVGTPQEAKQNCAMFIEEAQRRFKAQFSCYVGLEAVPHQLAKAASDLLTIRRENVAPRGQVFMLDQTVRQAFGPEPQIRLPAADLWLAMLEKQEPKKIVEEARKYLEHSMETTGLDTNALYIFQQDFLQLFYFVLRNKGIRAHELLHSEETLGLQKRSTRSLEGMLAWIEHIVREFKKHAGESMSVIEQVEFYIAQNIDDLDITCKDIADYVGYNPDYLNRLFREKTGSTIVEYLLQERIEMAKKLLVRTNLQVSTIASQVGYTNFSYFTKIFKRHVKMTPSKYRRTYRSKVAEQDLPDSHFILESS